MDRQKQCSLVLGRLNHNLLETLHDGVLQHQLLVNVQLLFLLYTHNHSKMNSQMRHL